MHIEEARDLFPGCRDQVYLDVALNGLLSTASRDAAVEHLETRLRGRARKEDLHAPAEAVRREIARLLGGRAQEVAITKNVSEGLNLFASSLDCRSGDNVVFWPELEHPNRVPLLQPGRAPGRGGPGGPIRGPAHSR